MTSFSSGPTCFVISQLLNISGKELSLWKLVQCLREYQGHFINTVVGTKLMQNQSIRPLLVLPLWCFGELMSSHAVVFCTVICWGGNNTFWMAG